MRARGVEFIEGEALTIPERILVVQLKQRGDILMCTPTIRAIKEQCPDSFVGFLAYEMGREILEPDQRIDCKHFYNPKFGLKGELRLMQDIRRQKYEAVIDFWNSNRGGLYSLISGSPIRVSYESRRRAFYTDLVPKIKTHPPLYSARDKFRLLSKIGIEGRDDTLSLPWTFHKSESQGCPVFLDSKATFRVMLSPTHRRAARRWPLASYASLGDRLVERWGAEVIWVWGPGEERVGDRCKGLMRRASVKAPATTLRQLGEIMKYCDLFVGNSNGPSHIAVALGLPSLQIHGPTYASSWSPLNQLHWAVEVPPAQKESRGIQSITVDEVWGTLQGLRQSFQREEL